MSNPKKQSLLLLKIKIYDMNILLIIIIVLTIIVSFKGFENTSFFRKFEFHIGSIRSGEQFRMISSAFLHADISHLAFNMLTLYLGCDGALS
jgi:membrane associated rhomboid family serine protease